MAMQEIVSYQAANLEDIAARLEDEQKAFEVRSIESVSDNRKLLE
jgi:hypothetical protein